MDRLIRSLAATDEADEAGEAGGQNTITIGNKCGVLVCACSVIQDKGVGRVLDGEGELEIRRDAEDGLEFGIDSRIQANLFVRLKRQRPK